MCFVVDRGVTVLKTAFQSCPIGSESFLKMCDVCDFW